MRNDNAVNRLIREVRHTPAVQRGPELEIDIFAVNLRHLLCVQVHFRRQGKVPKPPQQGLH